jgi:hypothetical protein
MTASDETNLVQATRHVAEAEAWHAEQSAIVSRMMALGHDTTKAAKLLADFEVTLSHIRDHHQRLLRERKLGA